MPAPTTFSPVAPIVLSGNLYTDALLGDTRWDVATLTYSFPDVGAVWSTSDFEGYGPIGGGGEPWRPSFGALSGPGQGDDQSYFVQALQRWADVVNMFFAPVEESSFSVGDLRAAYTAPDFQDASTVAWAYFPSATPAAGDVWFSTDHVAAMDYWTPGSFAFLAVMHELGHALGLKHPFETLGSNNITLPAAYDTQSHTIMSYNARAGDGSSNLSYWPTTPMVFDIAAMQYVYGANTSYHAGDDTYVFDDTSPYHQTLWDAGGRDTFSYQGNYPATIDLREGAGSTVGLPVYVVSHYGANLFAISNVWIAEGARIENASGGLADDVLMGNDSDNVLFGGAGNDTLDGGTGIDIAGFAGLRSGFVLTTNADGLTVHDTQAEGTDQLSNVERLRFADQWLAMDLMPAQHAGQALELLGVLAPDLIGSPAAVGTVLARLDAGLNLPQVCQLALDLGLVRLLAGSDSNEALAAMAYQNVLGSAADAAVVNDLVGYMDGRHAHYSQADFLATAAELAVNQTHIGLVGWQQTGVVYAPDLQ